MVTEATPFTPSAPSAPAVVPALPTWTDPASVTSYVTSIVASVVAMTSMMTEHKAPAAVQALIPASALLIAGVAQIVNIVTHRGVHKAAIHAASISNVGW